MISNNFFAILRLPETWVAPDEIMEQCCVFFLAVFSHFKTSPRLRQLFGKMLQHCFVVKRQKMFCGLRNFTPPLSVGEESFLGWTYPLEECFLFTSTSVNDLSTSSTGTDADTEKKKKSKEMERGWGRVRTQGSYRCREQSNGVDMYSDQKKKKMDM